MSCGGKKPTTPLHGGSVGTDKKPPSGGAVPAKTPLPARTDGIEKPSCDCGAISNLPNPSKNRPGSKLLEGIEKLSVFFGTECHNIDSENGKKLLDLVKKIKDNGECKKIYLEGYTDASGSSEYNLALSKRRAKAVEDFLVSKGVDRKSIETVAYGEKHSAKQDHNKNDRRVDITLQC